jgi:hypothetical protein
LLKLIASWTHANTALLVNVFLLRLMRQKALVFAYEDIVKDFSIVTRKCGLYVQSEKEQPNHLIGGNRLAGGKKARIKPVVRQGSDNGFLVEALLWVVLGPIRLGLRLVREKH